MPLGMEDRRILSGHLRASSSYNYNHGPDRARLNIINGHGRTGAWVARHRNTKQWLQIDLRQISLIKGIATQGRREANQWVKNYMISFSRKSLKFRMYTAYGRVKVRSIKVSSFKAKIHPTDIQQVNIDLHLFSSFSHSFLASDLLLQLERLYFNMVLKIYLYFLLFSFSVAIMIDFTLYHTESSHQSKHVLSACTQEAGKVISR